MASIASQIRVPVTDKAADNASHVSSLTAPRTELSQHTINRFLETPAELYGRAKEVALLRKIYDENQEKVVFVSGKAGVGKSILVNTALRQYVLNAGGFFTVGKFEQLGYSKDPYAALVAAFTDLCDLILVSDDRQKIKQQINAEMGTEAHTLSKLIYNLGDITENKFMGSAADENYSAMFLRFKIQCRSFLHAVASAEHPVCIFLDDLQWMDAASMEVVNTLIKDTKENSHILIVCSFREGEFEPTKAFGVPDTTGISIDTLNHSDLNAFIADLMQTEPENTEELSDTILRKTNGNPFSVRQFLDLLRLQGMLFQSSGHWEWVLERILTETSVDNNVLTLVAKRVEHLHEHVQATLMLGAFLGHSFTVEALLPVIISEYSVHDDNDFVPQHHQIISILDQAVKENMLERVNAEVYQFTHDQIQQCLYHGIEDLEERQDIHLRIGSTLLQLTKKAGGAKKFLLMAVDHLNRGSPQMSEAAKSSLADINLEAGKQAAAKNSFYAAAGFFKHGINFMSGTEPWTNQYTMALELHSSAAEMCYATGDLVSSAASATEVLRNARSSQDMLRAELIVIDTLALQGDMTNAIHTGLDLLAKFGIHFPPKVNKGHIMYDIIKTKRKMGGLTDEYILSLPECVDPAKTAVFKLMSHLSTLIFWSGDEDLLVLMNLRLARLSCEEVSEFACEGFCMYGGVLAFFGDYSGAHRYGMLGLNLMEKLNAKRLEGRVRNTSAVACLHWKKSLGDVSRCLMRTYTSGLASGDVEIAFLGAIGAVATAYHAGAPLEELNEKCVGFAAEMKEYGGLSESLRMFCPLWQLIQNLRGKSDNPRRLAGEPMNHVDDLENGTASSKACFYLIAVQNALHFECHDDMKTLLPLMVNKHPPNPAQFLAYIAQLMACLVNFEFYRESKKRVYKRRACSHMQKLKRYVDKGAVGVKLPFMFAQAEYSAIHFGKKDATAAAYKMLIEEAKEQTYTEIACLGAERAVAAMINLDDMDEARLFLNIALDSYEEWGAPAKVEMLMTKYNEIME